MNPVALALLVLATGCIHILPIADFTFLKDVARESPRDARRARF